MNKKIILAAIAASTIHTSVIAGFFDNLVDNLQNGDLDSLVTDVAADITNEIDKAQDNSDSKSNAESDDVLDGLGGFFKKSDETDDTDDYAEEEVFENAINKDEFGELNSENNQIVVNYDQLSKKSSFFGPDDPKQYLDGNPFTGIVDHTWGKSGNRYRTEFKDGLKHGLEIAWFKSGKIRHKHYWINGYEVHRADSMLLEGKSETWYENGVKRYESAKSLEAGPRRQWYENGQLQIKDELVEGKDAKIIKDVNDLKNIYIKKGHWREDGTKFMESYFNQENPRQAKNIHWNKEGVKTREAYGYHVTSDTTPDEMANWIYKYNKRYDSYLLLNDKKGDLESLFTINTLPINNGNNSCHYKYLVSKSSGGGKKDAIQTSHSKDGYVITSDDFLQNCIPLVYKACKENNNTNKCDKSFYQGKYSAEYLDMENYKSLLAMIDKKDITDILSINRGAKELFHGRNKLDNDKSDELEEKRLNIFKDQGITKPNIYSGSDVKSTKVNGERIWKDLSGQPVTGVIFQQRYSKDSIFKHFFYVKDGLQDGLQWQFSPNGMPMALISMKKGKRNGVYMEWDDWGNVVIKTKYKSGVPEGRVEYYYDRGLLAKITNRQIPSYHLPTLVNEYDIFNKWKHVIKENYTQKLILKKVVNFKNRKKNGIVVEYWPNNKKFAEYNMVDGKIQGDKVFYDPWKTSEDTGEQEIKSIHKYVDNKKVDTSASEPTLSQFDYLSGKGVLGGLEAFMSATDMTATVNNGPAFGRKPLGKYRATGNNKDRIKLVSDNKDDFKDQKFVTEPKSVRCHLKIDKKFVGIGEVVIENKDDVNKTVEKCRLAKKEYFDKKYAQECFAKPDALCYERLSKEFSSVVKKYPDLSNWKILNKEKAHLLK
jgi:antitoxin component YwqK of YwqJK toxin-antitoxin module